MTDFSHTLNSTHFHAESSSSVTLPYIPEFRPGIMVILLVSNKEGGFQGHQFSYPACICTGTRNNIIK
jgi:hypothetical protein